MNDQTPRGKSRARLYQLVDDIVTVGSKELAEQLAVPDEKASAVMRQIAHQVCFINAGGSIYVPKDLEFELSQRDEKIWLDYQLDGPTGARKFTAERIEEIAAAHRLTVVQVYNIVRIMKRREIATRQGVLPGLEPADS